jgi:coenzyme Q-binding protein COQ10
LRASKRPERPSDGLRHSLTRILPYTPDQLFTLVGDVAQYPDFVPWVTSMRTHNALTIAEGIDRVDADAAVGFSFLKERFSTRVERNALTRTVTVSLISGPFRHLSNEWRFLPDARGTRVEFRIDFAFKSRLLDALLHANFNLAVNRLIACFEARAAKLYGRR